ncbi:AbrB/MazE/SpoVT family DNA-binding domain-containing protein [bacterium]|nr:AbrB/MazE/SpoVT family DNA-binding domain-containing protein [bacterium]
MSKVKAKIVRIGNSKGIRIPKTILEQCDFGEEVELEVDNNNLIIKPRQTARIGWEIAFKKMHKTGDDTLLIKEEIPAEWDKKEWEW